MDRITLSTPEGRLRVIEQAFAYPMEPHQRRHGPRYESDNYESYREWLRDDFSYRCVFSLVRETWIGRAAHFDIDHFVPQRDNARLVCDYDNLLYLSHRMNLRKSKKRKLPDPGNVALGKCLRVVLHGEAAGSVELLNRTGERIDEVLKLNHPDDVQDRAKWLRILRCAAIKDENLFRDLIGYPESDLTDLSRKRCANGRLSGLSQSAWHRKYVSCDLPEWY